MISSGTKRGLAAVAVSALAVAGVPLLASSASAVPGSGTISVLSQGPIRQGNATGGAIVLKSSIGGLVAGDVHITAADYSGTLSGTNAVGAVGGQITSAAFNVNAISLAPIDAIPGGGVDAFPDGSFHYTMTTAVTTGTASSATFGVVVDADGAGGSVSASDPVTNAQVTPTGAPASVSVTPALQNTATDIPTPDPYVVTVKDSGGNVTQLVTGEGFVASGAGVAISGSALTAAAMSDGVGEFYATSATGGTKPIDIVGNGAGATPATLKTSASVHTVQQATITADEFTISTGADNYVDGAAFPLNVSVGVNQSSVTFNVQSVDGPDLDTTPDDAGQIAIFQVDSSALPPIPGLIPATFAGKSTATAYTVLDANGKGSVTFTPDSTVVGTAFNFGTPAAALVPPAGPRGLISYARAAATTATSNAPAYITKVGSATSVTITALDQFGNPATGAQVQVVRGARNAALNPTTRTTVDAQGHATISLPDSGVAAGQEIFTINLYDDQYDASATNVAGGTINYTADGNGPSYLVSGATSDATATNIIPAYDATATVGTDAVQIGISGGTGLVPATVSVDNGALVLKGSDTTLDKGAASQTINLDALGAGSVKVIGTKFGVVNVTITSGGVEKVVKLTVKAPAVAADQIATARNVALEAPASAKANEVADFTATVTDAFGNVVPGVPASSLGFQITGPANAQNQSAATDANGEFVYSVLLTTDANSKVTVKLTGSSAGAPPATPQFGAAADKLSGATPAPGLTASENVATASVSDIVNIAALQAAVDAAQAKVDAAQEKVDNANDALLVAQGDLSVAQAQQTAKQNQVNQAKANVSDAKKALKKAKKKGKGVAQAKANLAAAQSGLNNAKGELSVAKAAVAAAQTKVDTAQSRLDAANAQLEAAQQALADAEAALAAAQG